MKGEIMFEIIARFVEIWTSWFFAFYMLGALPVALMIVAAIAAVASFNADYCDAMNGYDARHFDRSSN